MRTVRASIREFWGFVNPEPQHENPEITPCWEWCGPTAYNGYMAFRSVLAHRAAATIYCGRIPASVSPRCGNRKCVRMEHMNIAHSTENVDRYTPVHKQPDVIAAVLESRGSGKYTISEISEKTGYSTVTIKKILREAPLYDLLADIANHQKNRMPVQTKPNSKNPLFATQS